MIYGTVAEEKELNPNVVEQMLSEGYTMKMIKHYFHYINLENEDDFKPGYMNWCHKHGFIASHASALGVNSQNYTEFVSDYDWYKTWPHNSWLRMWINDKLTFKYILTGTKFEQYTPEYYFYTVPEGGLRCLVDNPKNEPTLDAFIRLLQEKKAFACKPNNGTESAGFYKLAYTDGEYCINSHKSNIDGIKEFVEKHPNYIFTEYLYSGGGLEKVHRKIHTLRLVVINESGNDPIICGGCCRFAMDSQGETNHEAYGKNDYAIIAKVDFAKGIVSDFTAVYNGYNVPLVRHPDTNCDLTKLFQIPNWEEVVSVSKEISNYLFGTEIIGFDYGITENGLKIMEINGLSGNRLNQFSREVYDNTAYVQYVNKKIDRIERMSHDEKFKRTTII